MPLPQRRRGAIRRCQPDIAAPAGLRLLPLRQRADRLPRPVGAALVASPKPQRAAGGRAAPTAPIPGTQFAFAVPDAMDHRILIADDDADVRQGAAELLLSVGLEVLQACDGEEAIVVVRRSIEAGLPLHLALVDVHMPPPAESELAASRDDGGIALFTLLRGQRPELPCILWSGEASDGVADWALREGASAFLRKPVKPLVLRDEIRRILDQHWGAAG